MSTKRLKRHSFVVNPQDNGGEQMIVTTDYYDNGDGGRAGLYVDQTITLHSYGNVTTFRLTTAAFTLDVLRRFVKELTSVERDAVRRR